MKKIFIIFILLVTMVPFANANIEEIQQFQQELKNLQQHFSLEVTEQQNISGLNSTDIQDIEAELSKTEPKEIQSSQEIIKESFYNRPRFNEPINNAIIEDSKEIIEAVEPDEFVVSDKHQIISKAPTDETIHYCEQPREPEVKQCKSYISEFQPKIVEAVIKFTPHWYCNMGAHCHVEHKHKNFAGLHGSRDNGRCPEACRIYSEPTRNVIQEVQVIEDHIKWHDECKELENHLSYACTVKDERCSDQSVRTFYGKDFEKCWEKTKQYHCIARNSKNDCQSLIANRKCQQIASKCIEHEKGRCINWQQKYSCKNGMIPRNEVYESEGKIFCLDGSCINQDTEANDEIAQVLSELSIYSEAKLDNHHDFSIFKGLHQSCRKDNLLGNFQNCCAEKKSGWGQSLNLSQCEPEQQNLMTKLNQGYCHFTHQDKKGKILTKTTNNYCCFNSKLQKVFQVEARKQLGKGWGDGCRGLSYQELQQLDFSKLDFSEVIEDMQAQIKAPDQQKIIERIQSRVKEIFQAGKNL